MISSLLCEESSAARDQDRNPQVDDMDFSGNDGLETLLSNTPSAPEHVVKKYLELLSQYPAMSVRVLCEKVGFSRATFYRYFSDRDDLIQKLSAASIDSISDALAHRKCERAGLIEAIDIFLSLRPESLFLFRISHSDHRVYEWLTERLRPFVKVSQIQGELDHKLSERWVMTVVEISVRISTQPLENCDQMDLAKRFLLNGFGQNA